MKRFENRVALVTGAAQGIGKAIAELIASEGAVVYGGDIKEEALKAAQAEFESKGLNFNPVMLNVADAASCESAVKQIVEKEGRLEYLVNNAGVTRDTLLMRMKEEDWDLVLDINLKGAFLLTKLAIKPMMGQRFGRIVNISSVVGLMGNAGQANYSASKAGLIGFTKVVARELASRGVTCNAVAPGYIQTPMTESLNEKQREALTAMIPLARLGTSKDIADAVAFLLSDDASYITGHVLSVNGGMYM
ncbi:MAG TPA: 3-oxoacyl-[acyl-carrier-protein] reductase [Acidobacteriota bacterium]|nr:3-oxoacyl-[acyl-carrier-protein] reductase [Acidobacteriota bacterium]HNT16678.1 3-oxoacyl-[acyl-carrier-protein] reductase [Acidobacteriota bacterium]HPA26259.1 3-oxoacyl-[acyl-carrier-protein] reductase [Acidobacteriota bacterium]HQO19557.1 3-oxoacyl-[acyl-carrier-protein] reductase [Acidobacteriota bacterium]HQQ46267.1 3-oxoacyl-[acyl-carrier-protein] reductase [Acidobacteriota bacterium]